MRTYSPSAKDITRDWFVVDAEGQTLGRLATRIATVLRGKQIKQGDRLVLRSGDYVKTGVPLVLIMVVTLSFLLVTTYDM